jgi:hypothetical protein
MRRCYGKGRGIIYQEGESKEEGGESKESMSKTCTRRAPLRLLLSSDLLSSCHNPNRLPPRQLFWPHCHPLRVLDRLGSRRIENADALLSGHYLTDLWYMESYRECILQSYLHSCAAVIFI